MRRNEIYNELAGASLSPSMRDIQISVMVRLAMAISVSQGELSLECSFESQSCAVWLKSAARDAYLIPSNLKRAERKGRAFLAITSFEGESAKRLLLFTRLLDVKTKRISPSLPSFIDLSSIPAAKAVLRGAFMARGEWNNEKKPAAKILCPSVEIASQLEKAASALGVGVQIDCHGRKKSVEASPAQQTLKLFTLIGAAESAKKARKVYERKGEEEAKRVTAQLFEANARRSREASKDACQRVREALKILDGPGLKPELKAAGELRLKHPEATLSELGKLADPPLSKDALAGRLRRLCKKAQEAAKPEKGKKPKR